MNNSQPIKLRDLLFPVSSRDLAKFLPLAGMFFCFVLIHALIKNLKDAMVVTRLGSEMLPYLKFWGTLPASIVFVFIFYKCSNIFRIQSIFCTVLVLFAIFFATFGLWIYPNLEALLLTEAMQKVCHSHNYLLFMGDTFSYLLKLVSYWPLTMFYVSAELWSSIGITLLFWQLMNSISTVSEAKRYYAGLMMIGNLGPIIGGLLVIYYSNQMTLLVGSSWEDMLSQLLLLCCTAIGVILALYYYLHFKNYVSSTTQQKTQTKLSILESLKVVFQSKILAAIFFIILGYGVSIQILEVVWKGQICQSYDSPASYNLYMGKFSIYFGVFGLFLSLVGKNIIRYCRWVFAALITPFLIGFSGELYLLMVYLSENISSLTWLSVGVLIIWGSTQNIFSKGAKHALFDPTKEMVYIPLDVELKNKGKAALDVVGYRIAKSFASLVLQITFIFGSVMEMLPILMTIILVASIGWVRGVLYLNKSVPALSSESGG